MQLQLNQGDSTNYHVDKNETKQNPTIDSWSFEQCN